MSTSHTDVKIAVIGAGIVGIATAYYLARKYGQNSILLIDQRSPLSYTSAQSGDNYRNWWPHPIMQAFTDHSIDLMEAIVDEVDQELANTGDADPHNPVHMTRGGYALATRADSVDALIEQLTSQDVRVHKRANNDKYLQGLTSDWRQAPGGVDVLSNRELIHKAFPSFSPDIQHLLHIRRAGDFNSQQLGQIMMRHFKAAGGKELRAAVIDIHQQQGFQLECRTGSNQESLTTHTVNADIVVNAAGPMANEIAKMLGTQLQLDNIYQQKVMFADTKGLVPRQLPFSIDLDQQQLHWSPEERELLMHDPETAHLCQAMPGGTHCRPEGGMHSNWVKLGWATNTDTGPAYADLFNDPHFDPSFPELVIRAASALQPALLAYTQDIPGRLHHYGGYYTMTPENWPLIGPMKTPGAYMVTALSGFGSMSACAAGELVADWICEGQRPDYATAFSAQRYSEPAFMQEIIESGKGIL